MVSGARMTRNIVKRSIKKRASRKNKVTTFCYHQKLTCNFDISEITGFNCLGLFRLSFHARRLVCEQQIFALPFFALQSFRLGEPNRQYHAIAIHFVNLQAISINRATRFRPG